MDSMSNYFLNESFTFIAFSTTPATSIINDTPGANATLDVNVTNSAPLDDKIALTIVYAFIFVSGILGNVITCVVISQNKSMHTATNYYLTR